MKELRALRILDFQSIRDRVAEWCETEMGFNIVVSIQPEFDAEKVWNRLGKTIRAYDLLGIDPPPTLRGIKDVRGPLKLASKGAVLGGKELSDIGIALHGIRLLREYLDRVQVEEFPGVGLEPQPKLEREISLAFDSDGTIRDEASSTLGDLRRKKRAATARVLDRIQSYTSGPQREMLSDPIYTVRDGRYVIPLRVEFKGRIKGIIHDTSSTGSTVFLEPDDVVNAANSVRQIEAQEKEEEKRILTVFSAKAGNQAEVIIGSLTLLGDFDSTFGRARYGSKVRACVPEKIEGHRIEIEAGKHPLLDPESVVPTDISVGVNQNVLITGPNTGGKTVAIKLVGLFVAMLQCGILPPARHCRFGHFTQLFADIGDEQSIEQSLSTFSAHLKNIASALNQLKPGALVLLDEVGAGTDPAEGAALAQSILVEMRNQQAAVLASTHYGELKAFAFTEPGFMNASMEFDHKSLRPTYRLILGAAGASQALRIAERYGISKSIIDRATEYLSTQEQDVAEMLQNLEIAQKQARVAQGEADRRAEELKRLEKFAEAKLTDAENIRKRANERATDAIETELRRIRLEAEDLFDLVKKGQLGVSEGRDRVRNLNDRGNSVVGKLKDQVPQKSTNSSQTSPQNLKKGDAVEVLGFQQDGVLLEDATGKEVLVQLGVIKMKVDVRKLTPKVKKSQNPTSNKGKVTLSKTLHAKTEIHLRNKRAEDAIQELERFIDDAVLGNVPFVRIVHGKGEGILRQVTQQFLASHQEVKSFRDGDATEGGQGVTIANFK